MEHIVVIGASLAGLRAAEAIRRSGHRGRITLIGDEVDPPYDRPPLSKGYLAGEQAFEDIRLRPHEVASELELELELGTRAVGLDPSGGLELADGRELAWDGAVIATGARARPLAGTEEISGVHLLRTRADADALAGELAGGSRRVLVIGGGFIGCEVAATARSAGHAVTVVDPLETLMVRGLGTTFGPDAETLHRSNGVELILGVGVDAVEGDGAGRVRAVHLSNNTVVEVDVVVVGIGAVPNTEWLEGSGLELDDGVVCDETCLAAPGIVVAGDVARFPSSRQGGQLIRLEHWDNAGSQGAFAGRRLIEGESVGAYDPIPSVWSDQYDVKIQLVGATMAEDDIEVVSGDRAEHRFAALHGRDGRLVGATGFSRPRHVIQAQMRIEQGMGFADAVELARG